MILALSGANKIGREGGQQPAGVQEPEIGKNQLPNSGEDVTLITL